MNSTQQRVTLLIALLFVAQTVIVAAKYLFEIGDVGRFGGDFICFFEAAARLGQGKTDDLYEAERWAQTISEDNHGAISWFVYPPVAFFMVMPLIGLSYTAAVSWWSIVPLPVVFALILLLALRTERNPDRCNDNVVHRVPQIVLFAAALPLLCANILSGQTGALLAIFLMMFALFFRRRPFLAGIFVGFVAIKPQLGILLPFALVAAGQWRTFLSATLTIIVLSMATTIWLGSNIWLDYLEMAKVFGNFIGQGYNGIRQLAVGPYVSLISVGIPSLAAALIQVIMTFTIIIVILLVFRDERLSRKFLQGDGISDLRFGVLAAGILLATPYSLTYDAPLLLLSIVPILKRAWREGWVGREGVAVAAVLLMPLAQPIAIQFAVPFGFLAVFGLFLVLVLRYRVESENRVHRDAAAGPSGGGAQPRSNDPTPDNECLARHSKGLHVQFHNRFFFSSFGGRLLAKGNHLAKDACIEAIGFRFAVDFLDIVGDCFFVLLKPFDTFNDRLQLVGCNGRGIVHRVTPNFATGLFESGAGVKPDHTDESFKLSSTYMIAISWAFMVFGRHHLTSQGY